MDTTCTERHWKEIGFLRTFPTWKFYDSIRVAFLWVNWVSSMSVRMKTDPSQMKREISSENVYFDLTVNNPN